MKIVGQPIVRLDGLAKVTGKARYSYEIPVAGVAYAVMITSGIARGRILAVDSGAAEREVGVIAVITPFNAMKLPGGLAPADPADRIIQAMQDDRILYSNQPVAVAVADTFERAVHAALLVKVETQAEKPTMHMEDELRNGFPHDILNSGGLHTSDQILGDVGGALRSAQVKVEELYETPPETHSPLEPHATIAVWSGTDKLTVYDATQGIFGVRKKLARAFKLPLENVRVITKFVGGGFGCKGVPWSHITITALVARQLDRPVKLALLRPQMFGPVGGRPQTRQKLAVAAGKDGKLTGLRHESTSTTSRFDNYIEPCALVSRHQYACSNIETTHRLVRLDIATPTYDRAPGESTGSFALESAMDELAYELGIDPIELRLRNHAAIDPTNGKPFSSKSLRQCYALGAKTFGWKRRRQKPRATVRDGMLVGMGMATASYPANFNTANAVARMAKDGSAAVQSGAVDIGGGTYTVMAQVAAEALGLPLEKVFFDLGDTRMPEAPRSGGSTTAASVSSAVLLTCRALRDRLIHMAIADGPLKGSSPDDVQVEDGRLSAGGKSDTYAAIVERAGGAPVEERREAKPGEARKQYSFHSFGAQFAEVYVDPELGTIRVVRLVGAFAAGRILNARTARSQFMSGMVWGIGMALLEHSVYDRKLGRIMSRDLADYHVPVNADVVELVPLFLELEEDPYVDPGGVKGIGEIGITGAAAAIANAVFNATGKRIRTLPITLDKLL